MLVLCVVLAAFARPVAAPAATPCWVKLLNDWYDGRIDKTYPIQCYRDAIRHLPTDVQVYSSARDDIERALASAVAQEKKHTSSSKSGKHTSAVPVVPPSNTSGPAGKTKRTSSQVKSETSPTVTSGRQTTNGPFGEALDKLNPGSANSFPLPLLILGGLAIMLVLAGLAGLGVRRYQARGHGA